MAAWIPSIVASCRWNGVRGWAWERTGSDEEMESARIESETRVATRLAGAGDRLLSMAIPLRVCGGLDWRIRISHD
jgi:hypothetical protein